MYGLNQTPVRPLHPGDQFSTPAGVLTVKIEDGGVTFHAPAGNVVPVHLSTFRYTAHCRSDGRQVWPPVEAKDA